MWFRKFANLKACKTTAKHMFINTNDFKLVLYSSVVYVYEFVHSMEQRLGSNWYGSSVTHMEATMSMSCRCCLMSTVDIDSTRMGLSRLFVSCLLWNGGTGIWQLHTDQKLVMLVHTERRKCLLHLAFHMPDWLQQLRLHFPGQFLPVTFGPLCFVACS